MEITQADLRIGDYTNEFIGLSSKNERNEEQGSEVNFFYAIDVKDESFGEARTPSKHSNYIASVSRVAEPNLNSIQHERGSSNILTDAVYLSSLDTDLLSEEIDRRQATEALVRGEEHLSTTSYNISTVVIPNDILEELSLSIKKENTDFEAADWLREESKDSLRPKIGRVKNKKREEENDCKVEIESRSSKLRRRRFRRGSSRHEYRERLRKKAECMREKRKKLYEEESQEERLERLAREAAKRREMRMYYETPEQRRKRLDAEAARKREYRMYNETPDERRKRLDREAERRRVKRLTIYASETPEQRRERLNKESAKRREARLNQYAKETEDQRQERLRKDALRAREMRFTRSAIETDEERRQRLVKDALRKRELRMHGGTSVSNFTELQTVRNFEELNNVQMKEDDDNQLGGHYLSNWMMWFQNTLTQPVNSEEQSDETRQQTDVS